MTARRGGPEVPGSRGAGTFTPAPGRASMPRIVGRYARLEMRLTVRRGEAVVFTIAIPVLAIVIVGLTDVINLPTDDRLGFVVPGAIALAIMSNAFTSLAIATGYERGYGVLKRLGASSLTRLGLVTGKTLAVLAIVTGQAVVLAALGVALGWRPALGQLPSVLAVTLLATAAFASFGLLMAARFRPETTTGATTLIYLLLLTVSGVMFPLPDAGGVELLNPLAAYAETLRQTLTGGEPVGAWAWNCLGLWAVIGVYAAAGWFRWE